MKLTTTLALVALLFAHATFAQDPSKPAQIPAAKEGRPVTLQDALLNYNWSWVGRRNETDVFLTFKPDGTVSHRGMTGTWKIMGTDTLRLTEYKGRTLTLQFDAFFENYKCTSGAPDLHGKRVPK